MYLCGDISKIRNERDWKPQTEFENGIRIMINKQTNKQTTEQTNKHPISNYGNYIRYINGICYHKIFIKKRFSYA